MLRDRFQHLYQLLSELPRAAKLVWSASRYWSIAWLILLIIQGLLPGANVYLIRLLVNSLTQAFTSLTPQNINSVITFALLLGITILLMEILQVVIEWTKTIQSELIRDYINDLIHKHSMQVDFAFYETPEYYDHLYQARYEGSTRVIALIDSIGSLVQNSITAITIGALLVVYELWLPAILLLSLVPSFYSVLRFRLREHEWRISSTPAQRRLWYYFWLLTDPESAAELRIFDLGELFRRNYIEIRDNLRSEQFSLANKNALIQITSTLIGMAIMGLVMAWMVWRGLQGFLTLGDLALFYQAFERSQKLIHSLLQHIGHLYSNSLFLTNLFAFLDMTPSIISPSDPKEISSPIHSGIDLHKVTFAYPNTTKPVIENFDLHIPAGKIVALIGSNGSGKSTILKLICRLYDPGSGSITVDGIDIRDTSLTGWRNSLSVLFQQPVHYSNTIGENIMFGAHADDPEEADLLAAAETSGAEHLVRKLPEGMDTLLGKWFEKGHELSVGEWKRVALARSVLRNASITLLDEPTSAMDPWTMETWSKSIPRIFAGQTVLVITHHLSTAKYADLIYVMMNGKIVESGTHEELLKQKGPYAKSLESNAT